MKKIFEVFLVFTKIGVFGFGGGYATIPLIQKEVVEKKGWLSEDELGEGIAFANIMPGPFAPQLAALCGYRAKGVVGAIVALMALLLPSCIAIVGLGYFYSVYKDEKWMIGITRAIKPVVVVLIATVVFKMAKKAFPKNRKELFSFNGVAILVLAFLTIIGVILSIYPVFMIISAMIFGALFFRVKECDVNE